MSDERSLDTVEQFLPVAKAAGLTLTHMALAFVVAHPGVTSAILGPRTMEQFDDLIAAAQVSLDDATLDRIEEIVPPGTDIAPLEGSAYMATAIKQILWSGHSPVFSDRCPRMTCSTNSSPNLLFSINHAIARGLLLYVTHLAQPLALTA